MSEKPNKVQGNLAVKQPQGSIKYTAENFKDLINLKNKQILNLKEMLGNSNEKNSNNMITIKELNEKYAKKEQEFQEKINKMTDNYDSLEKKYVEIKAGFVSVTKKAVWNSLQKGAASAKIFFILNAAINDSILRDAYQHLINCLDDHMPINNEENDKPIPKTFRTPSWMVCRPGMLKKQRDQLIINNNKVFVSQEIASRLKFYRKEQLTLLAENDRLSNKINQVIMKRETIPYEKISKKGFLMKEERNKDYSVNLVIKVINKIMKKNIYSTIVTLLLNTIGNMIAEKEKIPKLRETMNLRNERN